MLHANDDIRKLSMIKSSDVAICTWFIADTQSEATYFPQIGMRSDAPQAQATYWRCVLCFFASSVRLNPTSRHMFFTNVDIPSVDGFDLATALDYLSVEIVKLPITYRLPAGAVSSWGNQFYVFDILEYAARDRRGEAYIVLDSDCIWLRPVEHILPDLLEHGALTYELDEEEHHADEAINGLSRQGMGRFVSQRGKAKSVVAYCGGEIVAADLQNVDAIVERLPTLWPSVLAGETDSPREEAHLLSVIYALNGVRTGTANRYIKRMWTNFRRRNVTSTDFDLTIWHLPSEKKMGFARLFQQLTGETRTDLAGSEALDIRNLKQVFGIPRRSVGKLFLDLTIKGREKIANLG